MNGCTPEIHLTDAPNAIKCSPGKKLLSIMKLFAAKSKNRRNKTSQNLMQAQENRRKRIENWFSICNFNVKLFPDGFNVNGKIIHNLKIFLGYV
jgi:hypothetical protein